MDGKVSGEDSVGVGSAGSDCTCANRSDNCAIGVFGEPGIERETVLSFDRFVEQKDWSFANWKFLQGYYIALGDMLVGLVRRGTLEWPEGEFTVRFMYGEMVVLERKLRELCVRAGKPSFGYYWAHLFVEVCKFLGDSPAQCVDRCVSTYTAYCNGSNKV